MPEQTRGFGSVRRVWEDADAGMLLRRHDEEGTRGPTVKGSRLATIEQRRKSKAMETDILEENGEVSRPQSAEME